MLVVTSPSIVLLAGLAFSMLPTARQAPQHPFYYYNQAFGPPLYQPFYHGPYAPFLPYAPLINGQQQPNERLFFGGGGVTSTSITTATFTYTSTLTCTKKALNGCDFKLGSFPWSVGFSRRRRSASGDAAEIEYIESSPVLSVEPTANPESPDYATFAVPPAFLFNIEPSFDKEHRPFARQLFQPPTTITHTVSTTTVSYSTRTLTPLCIFADFGFPPCPT